ncbi:MAG: putative sulfate/molybdate transporter [Bacteroidota bacterium]|nr:putative sulfate/molybdate transporter [Bacteroidota bacterium]
MQSPKIQFTRNEFAGAFGDIGTDFPLIVALILTAGLHAPSVLIVFGVLQIATGYFYKMPMPVQPLKAMATLVISQKIGGPVLIGAGLAIGILMLFLTSSGLLKLISQFIPKAVIRGIQFGLGLSLCSLAVKDYILPSAIAGYVLAGISFLIILLFIKNKRFPAAIVVLCLGLLYALLFEVSAVDLKESLGLHLPILNLPSVENIVQGFLLLSLPQIPLSIGNSVLATQQASADYFPKRKDISISKLGYSYSFINLISPFFSGIPVCHGAGGLVGHYTFGGRSGASVIIYGFFYLVLGLFFGNGFSSIIQLFPLPILGVILLFEGLALLFLIHHLGSNKKQLLIALITGIIAFLMPYGYLLAMIVGSLLYFNADKIDWLKA